MSEISLKIALRLRKALEAVVTKPALNTSAKLSILIEANRDNPAAAIEIETKRVIKEAEDLSRLSYILHGLRISIAKANIESGVDENLALIAHLDREIAIARLVVAAGETPIEEELKAQIALAYKRIETPDLNSYQPRETWISCSAVSKAILADYKAKVTTLQRQREAYDDARIAANSGARIKIADEDNDFLRERGIF